MQLRSKILQAFTLFRHLPESERRTGIHMQEVRSWASQEAAKKEHFIRAALESMAYQTNDILKVMEEESGVQIRTLKVDGGASNNNFLMQFQADILNKTVLRPAIRETTALGAAYLAGLATGVWKDRDEIRSLWHCNMTFAPQMEEAERTRLLAGWHKAVGRSCDWAEH